jgi:replication factor C subunit 3/5
MSDYEDEMDVDAPSKDVQFSSENASGKKRTAADLPVQALDNLPWYDTLIMVERLSANNI